MSSDPLRNSKTASRTFRKIGPWLAWGAAVAVAIAMHVMSSGLGTAPAAADTRQVSLSAMGTARVLSVEVTLGQRVTEGQLLVKLDPAETDALLAVAKAGLAVAEAEVNARRAALSASNAKTADKEAVEAEKASLALAQLESVEKSDRSKLEQLDEQIARETKLVESQLSATSTLNSLKLARAALGQTVESYKVTLKTSRDNQASAERRLAEWRAQGHRPAAEAMDPRVEAQLQPARAAVLKAKEELGLAERRAAQLDLRAPFDGTIGAVLLRAGDTVREGRPVITLVDDQPTTAIAYVDQTWAGEVKVGDEVTLEPLDKSGHARKGRVTALGPGIIQTPMRFQANPDKLVFSREAWVKVEADGGPLMPGQAFKADFSRGSAPVPSNAVGQR